MSKIAVPPGYPIPGERSAKSARYLLAKDLYQTGFVLKRKYVLLKYAYVIAVVGVILLTSSTVVLLFIQ